MNNQWHGTTWNGFTLVCEKKPTLTANQPIVNSLRTIQKISEVELEAFSFFLEFTWKYVAFKKKIKFLKLQCQEVKLWNSKKMALKGI